jgi:uncharacterized repeat protein (TIGR01451 family)
VASGANLTYSITVKDAGPDTAQQVVVQDTLPSASGFVSETSSQGSCIIPAPDATGTMTCSLGSIANAGQATITVVVNVKAPAGQSVSDTVSVSPTSSFDPNLANNTATVTTYVAAPTPTTTSIASSADPSVYGQSVTFTATVAPTSGSGTPTGTVTFTDGSTTLGTSGLSAGKATLTTSSLSVASHTIGAAYSGDGTFLPSSGSLTQTVNRAATKLTAAPATRSAGQFSATLTRADNSAPIGGQTVTFTVSTLTGTATLCSAVTNTSGVATCHGTVPPTALLATSFTATYAGNANYLSSSGTGKLS